MKKNQKEPVQYHFIPNTHWDREWLYDFQETRMFLVEFMDKLLDIFNKYPDYKTYLLDSQTVPLEDYLEIRPEKMQEIKNFVEDKRLYIGPWYTLPEEHLVNGESLVRNLLYGHKIGKIFGGVMKVGYSPFSYGQASQMPQIYRGFDIDTILFYHGIQSWEAPSEFIFEGADGSQLLASRMGSNARYNFFFSVYRPVVYGKETLDRNYFWKEGGLPFHLASEEACQEHHILLDPVKHLFSEKIPHYMERLKEQEQKQATTPHIACMQGMDSTQPDEYERNTYFEVKRQLKNDAIKFSSLPEWLDAVKASINWSQLKILKGERRTPRQLGSRVHLYGDVTSARTPTKRKNALTEMELQRKAEPFASLGFFLGEEYPKAFLDIAWKYLLKGHPHDSIAGTGVDQIDLDLHHRLDQCRNICRGITRRALQAIQKRINNSDLQNNEVALTIYNTAPYQRSEIINAVIDLPLESGYKNYVIVDGSTGEKIAFQEIARYEHPSVIRHLSDATMEIQSLRVHLYLHLKNVPAFGYHTLIIKPEESFRWPAGSLKSGPNIIENKFIRVEINSNGTLQLTNKETGFIFKNLHYFQDNGEAGHAWRHVPPARDRLITTHGSKPKIEYLESGPLAAKFAILHIMKIPVKLDPGMGNNIRRLDADGDDAGRSEETKRLVIRSEFILRKESRGLEVKTTFENNCENHRLRVMFPTHLKTNFSYAEEPFDVVEREIERNLKNPWQHTWNPTHPHQRFVDISDGGNGLAIINDGLREYEITDDDSRTIGITLMRAFELALCTVAWRWEMHPEMKGSQSLGKHEYKYYIYPHSGDWDKGRVIQEADKFNVSMEIVQAGFHRGNLPKSQSFMEINPTDLQLTCLKKSELNDSLILRFYNPTDRKIAGKIKLATRPGKVRYVDLNEAPLKISTPDMQTEFIHIEVEKKKIVTLELTFDR